MAFNDEQLVDTLKTFYGNSDMSDEEMQEVAEDWFLQAPPLERSQTLSPSRPRSMNKATAPRCGRRCRWFS